MPETTDEIVRGSSLPISIIIVGIGDGNFTGMEILNANEEPLYSKKHKKEMERDIVQFVYFNKFKNNTLALASETLDEVPRQLTSYMKSKGRRPTDKVVPKTCMKSFSEMQQEEFKERLKARGFTDEEVPEIMSKPLPERKVELYPREVILSPFKNCLTEYVAITKK